MKNSNRAFTIVEVGVVLVVFTAVVMFGKAAFKSIFHNGGPSAAQVALTAEKASAAKTGQQFAAATTKEIAKAKDQSDPAIAAATKTAARADVALQTGLGSLTPSQAQWVQSLVEADAAAFQAALDSKDKELVQTGDKIAALERKVAAEQGRSSWFENLLIIAGIVFVVINYVLPWLEKIFPPLGAFVGAIHLVLNPFLVSAKAKAKEEFAAAEAKAQGLYAQIGQAVTDMRAKLGTAAASAIAHLDNNLDTSHADAISAAAKLAAASAAAAQADAAAQVQIVAS